MALIGTGIQAEFQALAFRAAARHRRRCASGTPTRAAMAKFVRNLDAARLRRRRRDERAPRPPAGADVITTCTADKANATVLRDDMVVRPACTSTPSAATAPARPSSTRRSSSARDVFVEYTEQTRIEGEIQQHAARLRR